MKNTILAVFIAFAAGVLLAVWAMFSSNNSAKSNND